MSIKHGNSIKNILSFWSQIAEINSKLGKKILLETNKQNFSIHRNFVLEYTEDIKFLKITKVMEMEIPLF